MAVNTVSAMSNDEFHQFSQDNAHLKLSNPAIFDFLNFLNKKPE